MKGFFKFIIGLIIILVIAFIAIFILISSPKKNIDVSYTSEDFQSYVEKGGIVFDEKHASMEDIFANNIIVTGTTYVNTTITNEELTAVANQSMNDNSIVKDVKIKCNDNNEIEMSCVVGDISPLINEFPFLEKYEAGLKLIENKPIYMNSTLFYDHNSREFGGVTSELYIGKVKIPVDQANDNLRPAGTQLNSMLKQINGFSVNDFQVSSEGFKFDGTIPQKIESAGKLIVGD